MAKCTLAAPGQGAHGWPIEATANLSIVRSAKWLHISKYLHRTTGYRRLRRLNSTRDMPARVFVFSAEIEVAQWLVHSHYFMAGQHVGLAHSMV